MVACLRIVCQHVGSGATRDISIEMKPVVLRTYFYASAIANSAFRDQSWRRRPRPNENCPLRIRCASSIAMAASIDRLANEGWQAEATPAMLPH
jgi:hypothetical protein